MLGRVSESALSNCRVIYAPFNVALMRFDVIGSLDDSLIVKLAVLSEIRGGTASEPSAEMVRVKTSSPSVMRSDFVETYRVFADPPIANEIVELIAV